MTSQAIAQFNDPGTVARYLGESVGTHYSSALRATEAYGRHLAANRESLTSGRFPGDGLRRFWCELLKAEKVRVESLEILEGLGTTPAHYFLDFLDTADAVYRKSYRTGPSSKGATLRKTEHQRCLAFLRDHAAGGASDHFTVRNKIATWMQLLRMTGGYRE